MINTTCECGLTSAIIREFRMLMRRVQVVKRSICERYRFVMIMFYDLVSDRHAVKVCNSKLDIRYFLFALGDKTASLPFVLDSFLCLGWVFLMTEELLMLGFVVKGYDFVSWLCLSATSMLSSFRSCWNYSVFFLFHLY